MSFPTSSSVDGQRTSEASILSSLFFTRNSFITTGIDDRTSFDIRRPTDDRSAGTLAPLTVENDCQPGVRWDQMPLLCDGRNLSNLVSNAAVTLGEIAGESMFATTEPAGDAAAVHGVDDIVTNVAVGLILAFLCLITFIGNAMVLHAVRTEPKLQTVIKKTHPLYILYFPNRTKTSNGNYPKKLTFSVYVLHFPNRTKTFKR